MSGVCQKLCSRLYRHFLKMHISATAAAQKGGVNDCGAENCLDRFSGGKVLLDSVAASGVLFFFVCFFSFFVVVFFFSSVTKFVKQRQS